ncbi:hypothetical protein, partial [Escherichia coli]|uniref:hypothetical protein n=2 Tax=Enterobacterales TaxID=91347 RepID=UPI00195D6241
KNNNRISTLATIHNVWLSRIRAIELGMYQSSINLKIKIRQLADLTLYWDKTIKPQVNLRSSEK